VISSPIIGRDRDGIADGFSFKVTRLGGLSKIAIARDMCALRSHKPR
jgi:hypothetical protein